ncbi:cytochrome P450 [Mycena rebaudengoi]|nr:cytochrome P450 [Mycena rebaudengoi]
MISQILVPIVGTLLLYLLFPVLQVLYYNMTSPLRHVAGPRSPSLIFGNFKEMAGDPGLTAKWRKEFGPNVLFKGLFSIYELHTSDLAAINHIVTKPDIYQKLPSNIISNERLFGKGLVSVELEEHRRQRRALNPAFGVPQIRAVTEIFVEKAVELRNIWARQVADENDGGRIEILSWLRRMTLDVIGQAGFNYHFDALQVDKKPNELNQVFSELFHSPQSSRYATLRIQQAMVPILRLVPASGSNVLREARNKMYAIGMQIVSKSKAEINASKGEKNLGKSRDLLSTLLKANLSTTIPETQRLNDAEIVGQIPTFFLAGHEQSVETTSLSTAWALYALSVNAAAQSKLREELLTLSTDNPTLDELNSLPYLEYVVREVMRVHAPVLFTQRMAMEDDVLPLSKPYIDQRGRSHDSLTIPKGQRIHIPILAINTDKAIWGEDASEFKPERWDKIPESVSAIPGVWANLFTFFAGPHNCIGFRFALAEMKALLFTLVRAFEFEPAVTGGIGPVTTGLLQRPTVLADGPSAGLPLIVKSYVS